MESKKYWAAFTANLLSNIRSTLNFHKARIQAEKFLKRSWNRNYLYSTQFINYRRAYRCLAKRIRNYLTEACLKRGAYIISELATTRGSCIFIDFYRGARSGKIWITERWRSENYSWKEWCDLNYEYTFNFINIRALGRTTWTANWDWTLFCVNSRNLKRAS